MYSKDGNDVTLRMTEDEYTILSVAMGFATKHAEKVNDRAMFRRFIKLLNSMNDGNPKYKPYVVPEI